MRAPALGCLVSIVTVTGTPAHAQRQDATGDWGGARTWLDDHGVHIDVDYTAEVFARLAGGAGRRAAYRGNVDAILTLDTAKLGLWPGGQLLVYGQNGHGEGISPAIGAVMLVSNLEAPDFTQLSELWYEQRLLDDRLRLRLGKQDANRELGGPRFPGNWINSSYGVIPSVPMPSFPTPGLGLLVAAAPARWLELRGLAAEAEPRIQAVDTAFNGDGAFLAAEALLRHGGGKDPGAAGVHTVGVWTRTGPDPAKGVFAVADVLMNLAPKAPGDRRSVQVFARFGWSPDEPGGVRFYAGGGVTLHGLLGRAEDTVGVGGGAARLDAGTEGFVELFYKLRLSAWLTFEPDVQLFVSPGGAQDSAFVYGIRGKIKL